MATILTRKGHEILVDRDVFEAVGHKCWYVSARGYVCHAYKRPRERTSREIKLHRLVTGAQAGQVVDHINGNKLDNRRANLRLCTQAENCRNNRKLRSRKTSRYKGVHWSQRYGRYIAQIQIEGKKLSLGSYVTEDAARQAYDKAARHYHGDFASTNEKGEE